MQHNFNSEKDNEQAVVKSEKYLTFNLSGEQYGLEILKVKEIIGLMEITRVPRIPDFVRGVINLRGKVIPIINLRKKFNMESTEDTEQTCIIIVDVMQENVSFLMGIIVDSVSEVLDISEDSIEETPTFGTSVSTVFIKGLAKTKDGIKILLNIKEVLTTNELQSLAESPISES
jgi:purine-binding chemotaxis protein CheW